MSHLVLLVALVTGASNPSRDEAEARRLIQQLASESYQAREAATMGLEDLGEKAAGALKAVKNCPDPEVKRRVARLLGSLEARARMRKIEAIKTSKLVPHEKGRKLKAYLSIGMSQRELEQLLGEYQSWGIWGTAFSQDELIGYKNYGLRLILSSKRTASGWTPCRVSAIELVGP